MQCCAQTVNSFMFVGACGLTRHTETYSRLIPMATFLYVHMVSIF